MIRKLLEISGLAILGVLLFHSAGWGFTAMFAWTNRYHAATTPESSQFGTLSYFALRAIEQLVVFVIPTFLFVSGYFIAIATGRNQSTVSWKVVWARIRSLLIPYLIWSVLLWGLLFVDGKILSVTGYAEALVTGRTNPAYYYVPLLISLYLISPWLVQWAKTRWKVLLIGTAIIQSIVQLLYYPALLGIDMGGVQPLVDIVPKWFFPARIFWFTLGIVVSFHLADFKHALDKYRWHLLALALLLYVGGIIEWEKIVATSGEVWLSPRETVVDTLFSLTVILCFITFETLSLPFSNAVSNLSSKSYGIYLIHSPVMEVVARGVYHFAPVLLGYQLLFQPLLLIFGLGVPLLLMGIVAQSPWRGYYRYIFG